MNKNKTRMTKRSELLSQSRKKIGSGMLERYTGSKSSQFHKYIILTNFIHYLDRFTKITKAKKFQGSVMHSAHSSSQKISMIDIRVGAPTAGLTVDILSTLNPKAVIFLGMVGGLHRSSKVGEYILPVAAIRGEGTTSNYMPDQVPSLPTFKIQKFISSVLVKQKVPYKSGVVHTTDYRFWEFDNKFQQKLKEEKVIGVEMECAAIFTVGFAMKVPVGALLMVSDLPLKPEGIKTKAKQKSIFRNFTDQHVNLGIKSIKEVREKGEDINLRHYEW